MRHLTYKCDWQGCEKTYSPNNGWYLCKRDGRYLLIGTWTQDEDLDKFEHFCGTEHFFKRISQISGKEI